MGPRTDWLCLFAIPELPPPNMDMSLGDRDGLMLMLVRLCLFFFSYQVTMFIICLLYTSPSPRD